MNGGEILQQNALLTNGKYIKKKRVVVAPRNVMYFFTSSKEIFVK